MRRLAPSRSGARVDRERDYGRGDGARIRRRLRQRRGRQARSTDRRRLESTIADVEEHLVSGIDQVANPVGGFVIGELTEHGHSTARAGQACARCIRQPGADRSAVEAVELHRAARFFEGGERVRSVSRDLVGVGRRSRDVAIRWPRIPLWTPSTRAMPSVLTSRRSRTRVAWGRRPERTSLRLQGERLRREGARSQRRCDPPRIARRRRPAVARRAHRGGRAGQAHERRGHSSVSTSSWATGRARLIVVPLPDDAGPHDVMHLMSFVSPVDRDLAVVFPAAVARCLSEDSARSRLRVDRRAAGRVRHHGRQRARAWPARLRDAGGQSENARRARAGRRRRAGVRRRRDQPERRRWSDLSYSSARKVVESSPNQR